MIERIAIITGVQDEADAFLPEQTATRLDSPLGEIRQLVHAEKQVSILCSGIGKVHAGAAALYMHSHFQPDLIMVIGTAGHVSSRQGDCFYLREALQADYGTLEKFGEHDGFTLYNGGAWPIGPADWHPFEAHPKPPALALPEARIATADCFVKCPERSGYLRDVLDADLVDMETAAVAQITAKLGIPWAGIKAVTDGANGQSSNDFHANLAAAAGRAADGAAEFLTLI